MKPQSRAVAVIAAALLACMGIAQAQKKAPPPIGALPLDKVIDMLDRNGNGCIDLEEGRNYTSRRYHALDANHDGMLDAAEAPPGPMETTPERPISLEAWQDAYTARFASFDKDGSGCLSRDEIEAGRASLAQGGQ